jgi:hypothetical protein
VRAGGSCSPHANGTISIRDLDCLRKRENAWEFRPAILKETATNMGTSSGTIQNNYIKIDKK